MFALLNKKLLCFQFVFVGYHGRGGPVTMAQPPYQPEVKAATIEAVRNLGFEFVDSNGPFQHGK